jgi:hypothetical protein
MPQLFGKCLSVCQNKLDGGQERPQCVCFVGVEEISENNCNRYRNFEFEEKFVALYPKGLGLYPTSLGRLPSMN